MGDVSRVPEKSSVIHGLAEGLRNFVEKKKWCEWAVDKFGRDVILGWFVGCHSAGQGGQLLFDNRYDVPESVRPHLGFEHRWDFE